jgi:hypothetical protein
MVQNEKKSIWTQVEWTAMEESGKSGTQEEQKHEISTLWLPNINTFVKGPHRGLLRHRAVVATCLSLTFGLLALSAVD